MCTSMPSASRSRRVGRRGIPSPAATFADALARLRHHLWFEHLVTSACESDMREPIPPELRRLVEVACYAP
jgi:hypothetical protein